MQHNSSPFVERKPAADAVPELFKQTFLLLAILQKILYPFVSLLQGKLSLQDILTRFETLESDDAFRCAEARSDTPAPSESDSQDSESTSDASDRTQSSSTLMSSVRILCRAIVQRDDKEVTRLVVA